MKRFLWLLCAVISAHLSCAQSFEVSTVQETYKGHIGDIIKASVRFKNLSEKQITVVVRKHSAQIGGTQKNYYCIDNTCLDPKVEDFAIKIDANQTFNSLQFALEAGLANGTSSVKYIAFNKLNPAEIHEFELFYNVDEKPEKESIYTSRQIDLQEVYPNPVEDHAFVNYRILDDQKKAKIVLYNILGNPIEEYQLPASENKVKIRTESLNAGVYFYTLYLGEETILTRKLVKK
jgi:hypothetical protein